MKRFFFVFSVILVIFLLVAAGAVAVDEFCSIKPTSSGAWFLPKFLGGWGITSIPYYGGPLDYPNGDVFIVKRASADDLKPNEVVLYSGGMNWLVKSGCIKDVMNGGVAVTRSDNVPTEIPLENVWGVYVCRIPHLAEILGVMKSALAIGVFAGVLIVSIVLWRVLPARESNSDSLSESDGDIASNLY
jgi:hypothetical protein